MEIDSRANLDLCIDFLSEEEKGSLLPHVLEKITYEWRNKFDRISTLQAEIEKNARNSEQQGFQIEKEVVDLRKELENETNIRTEAEKSLATIKQKFTGQEENLQKANERINSLVQQLEQLRSEQETSSAQSIEITASLESKTRMYNILQEEKRSLEEKLADLRKSNCEALLLSEQADATQRQMQFKERHFEQEREYLTRQLDLLRRQLGEKSTEVLTLRHDHTSSVITLQADLTHALEEARSFREESEAHKKEIQEKSKRIDELLKSLREARESESSLENSYRKELMAQENLANIYKDSCEDQQRRCDELERAVEELKQLLQEASEQFGALEKAKKKMEEDAQKSFNQRDYLIKELKEELDNANELIKCSANKDDDCIADLSPSAAAASQLLKTGLTLTQLYTEYMNTSQKLLKSEDENKRISRYLEQILKDIEEKSPFLRKQRDDYEKALDTINTLHLQIDNSIEELENQKLESEEAKRRSNFLGRENDNVNKQVRDLSKQVTILLTQLEAARAGLPPPSLSLLENTFEATSAGDIIDQHLVSFRNIQELQDQNLKLRTSLRDLSDKMESAEKTAVEVRTQELLDELEAARKELDDLKSARDRMQSTVENITKQRDVYRTIVNQSPQNKSLNGKPLMSDATTEEVENMKKSLDKAEREVEKVKKEYEDYRKEKAKNDQMEKGEIERMRNTCDKVKTDNIKLLSQAEYNEERLKTLQKNCEAYQRQVNALTENNDTLQGIVGRHESTIETLRESTLKLTKDLTRLEMVSANLREEKSLLKENEARLRAERDSMHNSQYSQSLIVSNLEAIKNNLEKKDSENSMLYENQIADLTKQCCSLRAKLESNVDLKEAQLKVQSLDEQTKFLKGELNQVKQSLKNSEQRINKLVAEKQELQEKSSFGIRSPGMDRTRMTSPQSSPQGPRYSTPYSRPGTPFPPRSSTPLPHTVRELQFQLSEEKAKAESLQQAMRHSQAHTENLKKMLDEQETRLKENTESAKAAEEEIKNLRVGVTEAAGKIKSLEQNLNAAIERENALKESSASQLMSITEDLEGRENELEEAQKKLEEHKKMEEKAKVELREQVSLSSEMQNKYEREVMLHGADLQAMAAIKEKLFEYTTQLETITAAKLKAEESVDSLKEGFEGREAEFKKRSEELKARTEELEEQNKNLLDQLTQLTDKMAAIQAKLAASAGDSANTSFSEEDARTSDQLREIIKYLRRERDVAAGKVEVANAEKLRLNAQKTSLDNKVDLLNKYLADEKEKNQTSIETTARYTELIRKVHTMDALSDSNRLLRQEKDSCRTELEEAKVKMASLQSQITPLQESLTHNKIKLESVMSDNNSLTDEKESYKKRTQELVEKLNRARPEDMIKLQQEVNVLQKEVQTKDSEINRSKNIHNNLQKIHQAAMAHKNQVIQQLQNAREELKKITEGNKNLIQEKNRLQQQHTSSIEKIQSLESSVQQSTATQQQEQQRSKDLRNQVIQQLNEVKQKEESARKEVETLKKTLVTKDATLKDMEAKMVAYAAKIDGLVRQSNQLRRIANKYKMQVEATAGSGESSGVTTGEEEAEEKKALRTGEAAPKKEDLEKLTEQITKLKEDLKKKEVEVDNLKALEGPSRIQSELELKTQELQKANLAHAQFKEKFQGQLNEISKTLDESQSKKLVYESLISKLEKEKEQSQQLVETLNKKLSMQQKLIENLQKQQASGSKVSPNVISIDKPSSDPPPTANIKPMAVPPTTPAISSPRSQPASQPGGSRSIPTASIRPMAPTPASSGQASSVVMVSPLETHNDGAVSSTVTLPQATVTPTPVAPASTTTQAFPPSLTATVSPTPVSQLSIASTVPFVMPQVASVMPRQEEVMDIAAPTTSGAADNLISQAIAMVAPQLEDRLGGQKRKLEIIEEEEDEEEESKRSRIQEEPTEEESTGGEEDTGEPSSSSNASQRKVESEIFIVSSDEDEGPPPPSQSGHEEEEQGNQEGTSQDEGGREAEAEERMDEPERPSAPSSSSPPVQPPPRPHNEHPSSSRQSLPHFHQLPQYEESVDDRIVPSTPTLVVPRPCEGTQGDGVSSLQVPSQGFEFGASRAAEVAPSSDGLAQMAEGGIIDVTRMDLGQLDDGTPRVVPGQQSSMAVSTEGNITSSGEEPATGSGIMMTARDPSAAQLASMMQQAEPDSVVHGRSSESEQLLEELDENSQGAMERPDQGLIQQQGTPDDEDSSSNSPQPQEEDEEDEGDLQGREEEDEEEEEDDDEELQQEAPHHQRATRSTRNRVLAQRGRTITPITWDVGSPRYQRPPVRDSRGVRGIVGSPGQPRLQGARPTGQRGRRCRPMYYRGGQM